MPAAGSGCPADRPLCRPQGVGARLIALCAGRREWVPGCGPRLIALGHGVFSPFRELEPEQLLEMFLEFSSWPEYAACSFHTAVQQVSGGRGVRSERGHRLSVFLDNASSLGGPMQPG